MAEIDTSRRVEGQGDKNAKICLIGEAPGRNEYRTGQPFVGSAGNLLWKTLNKKGIKRSDCYVTNVFKYRPPNNNVKAFYNSDNTLNELGQAEVKATVEELKQTNCSVYVLLGAEPLHTLGVDTNGGIHKYRGYVVDTLFGKPALATFHPSMINRAYSVSAVGDSKLLFDVDLRKALRWARGEIAPTLDREYYIPSTFDAKLEAIHAFEDSEYLSVDIEMTGGRIICVGLADNAYRGTCIVLSRDYREIHTEEELAELWMALSKLLHGPAKKIGQNLQFDYSFFGRYYHIEPVNVWCDTMIAHHIAWPELRMGLEVLASLYVLERFWKDDTKNWNAIKDFDTVFRYNVKDVCITYAIAFETMQQLKEFGLEEVYEHYRALSFGPALATGLSGIMVDSEAKEAYKEHLTETIEEYEAKLLELAGRKINPNSTIQVANFLYKDLGLPAQYETKGGKKRLTTDWNALAKLLKVATGDNEMAIKLILSIRRLRKLRSTYAEMQPDIIDGRMRTTYNVTGTKTGRLSSSRSPFGGGGNLQNLPRTATEQSAYLDED